MPAFEASVVAVGGPALTLPAVASSSQDLVLSWTPDCDADTVSLELDEGDSGHLLGAVYCVSPSADGTLTIPAAVLANFQPGETGDATIINSANTLIQTPAGWLTFSARALARGAVTFQ